MSQSVRTGGLAMNFPATAPCTYVRFVFSKTPQYGKTAEFTAVFWSEKSSQVKFANYLTVGRNGFTESRFSEQRTGIMKKCASARFYEMPHGFVKSIPLTYEEGIDRRVSSGFEENRILRQTAKQVFGNANPLCCFHHKNLGGFYEHQK